MEKNVFWNPFIRQWISFIDWNKTCCTSLIASAFIKKDCLWVNSSEKYLDGYCFITIFVLLKISYWQIYLVFHSSCVLTSKKIRDELQQYYCIIWNCSCSVEMSPWESLETFLMLLSCAESKETKSQVEFWRYFFT